MGWEPTPEVAVEPAIHEATMCPRPSSQGRHYVHWSPDTIGLSTERPSTPLDKKVYQRPHNKPLLLDLVGRMPPSLQVGISDVCGPLPKAKSRPAKKTPTRSPPG